VCLRESYLLSMQSQRQTLAQQQRLALSPQLVQSIKLMSMPIADLRDSILEEVEKNPALEVVSDPFDGADWSPRGERAETPDFSQGGMDEESDEHQQFIEGALHRTETLQERLLEQLGETKLPNDVRALAELVIQNLDSDGFHEVNPVELSGGDDPARLSSALGAVRALDPVGCATSGFRESLVVQAKLLAHGPLSADPLLERTVEILEGHFELLEKGRPDALAKAVAKRPELGFTLDEDEAEGVFEIVRSLDPFPGRAYDSTPESYAVPDVIVRKTEDDYAVVINDEEIPVIGLSPFFMELDSGKVGKGPGAGGSGEKPRDEPKEARDFARESVKEAQWFMRTIERRNLTLLKLARAIVVYQRDFFAHGPSRLAPLRMKDIADEIGMHETTVSRAANGKYLQCEWGVFKIRYFFSNQVGSTATQAGPAVSTGQFSKQGVKELVREILAAATEPLSDQKVSDLLAQRGIKVARRTVAKYRGELNLGSSYERA
jgi:RNA polymerase sigma-54 factor